MTLEPGARLLDRYTVERLLGEGGMGEVYLARDTRLNRAVALKVLPPPVASDAERMRRFAQEAKAAAALNHPNIAHVYEIGEAGGKHFIAMEYVEGVTLGEKIHLEKTPLRRLLKYLVQVAEGLAKAHAAGVVHRDLKPDNIMIARDGYAKLLDFGLAKLVEAQGASGGEASGETATAILAEHSTPGMVMGTVGYMSPEQAQGRVREIDHRSDIFSFGCILYEAATGRQAFKGQDPLDSLHKIVHAPTPQVRDVNPDAPQELQRIVRRCLAKEPDRRYQSIKDVAIELDELRQELEGGAETEHSAPPEPFGGARPSSQRTQVSGTQPPTADTTAASAARPTSSAEYLVGGIRGHKKAAAAVLSAVVLALGAAGFALYKFRGGAEGKGRPAPDLKIQRLTGDGKTVMAAISPDGKFLANVRNEAGQQSLWVKQISTNSNVQVVAPGAMENFYALSFTPDGSYVYFSGTDKANSVATIFRVPALGGSVSKVHAEAGHFSFSPDGKQLVFDRYDGETTEHALFIANSDGTNERKIASRSGHQWFRLPPAWSPDGKLIACGIADEQLPEYRSTIALFGVADGAMKELTSPKWDYIGGVAWLPDMSGIIFEAAETGGGELPDQIWEISYPAGEARRLTQNLNDFSKVSLTADGKTLVTVERETDSSIWVSLNADVNQARQITTGKADYTQGIAWTPDGRIVYVSTASGGEELWIMNADGTGARQLTHDGSPKTTPPVVSPDGRYIVYGLAKDGYNLWRIDIGGGTPVRLTNGVSEADPHISPDGRWVVYSSYTTGKTEIWRIPIEGGDPKRLTDFHADETAVSPDGKFIACFYSVPKTDRWRIAVIPFEGGAPVKTFDAPLTLNLDKSPVWAPDGRGITYIDMRGGVGNLWLQPLDGGAPKQLTDYKQNGIIRREWTRDGKRVAIVRGEETHDAVMITNFR